MWATVTHIWYTPAEATYAKALTRQDWKDVGEGLRIGRKLCPADRAFGAWCEVAGYTMNPTARTNAMWVTEHWTGLTAIRPEIVHPNGLRQEYRKLNAPPKAEKPPATPKAHAAWCKDHGFGDIEASDRSDAMWVSQNLEASSRVSKTRTHPSVLTGCDDATAHPSHIREWFNDQQAPHGSHLVRHGISLTEGKRHPFWKVQPAAHSGVVQHAAGLQGSPLVRYLAY